MAVFNLKCLNLPSLVMPIVATSFEYLFPQKAIYKGFFEKYGIKTPVKRALFLGKCAVPLYQSFSKNYPEIPSFVYSTLPYQNISSKKAIVRFGTHPLPSKENVKISNELKLWLNKTKGEAAVFVSGGTSSLIFLPYEGCDFDEIFDIEQKLLMKKIPIKEVNYVRMALSQLRGGGIGEILAPYKFFGFIWCDVEPKDFKFVGSAPLGGLRIDLKKEVERILKKREITIPFELPDKNITKLPKGCSIFKLADGFDLCKEIEKKLKIQNISSRTIKIKEGTSSLEAANIVFKESEQIEKPAVLIGNGEFLVDVKNKGKGGRCSHLAANVAKLFCNKKGWFFAAIATDGIDGSGDGGAFVHSEAKLKLKEIEESINNCETGTFFKNKGMYFKRKPTGNNLRDLWILTLE